MQESHYLYRIIMRAEILGSAGFLEEQYAWRHSTVQMHVNLEVGFTAVICKK
jgi:hypothetical protein